MNRLDLYPTSKPSDCYFEKGYIFREPLLLDTPNLHYYVKDVHIGDVKQGSNLLKHSQIVSLGNG